MVLTTYRQYRCSLAGSSSHTMGGVSGACAIVQHNNGLEMV